MLIFPLIVNIKAYYKAGSGRVLFNIIIAFIPVNGFVRIKGGVIYIHFGDKFAVAVRPLSLKKIMGGSSGMLRSVEILKLYTNINFPYRNEKDIKIPATFIPFLTITAPIIKTKKPFADIYNYTTVGKGDKTQLFIDNTFALNLISLITMGVRKLKNGI